VSAPTTVRLRWPVYGRLCATGLQQVLSAYAVLSIPLAGLLIWKEDLSQWPYLIVDGLLVALWLRGLTGWARVDDDGLHWRYWVRWDHPWPQISRVTLTRRANIGSYRAPGSPIILVRAEDGDEDFVTPALACGRRRREFGTAVLAAARAHGIRTEVTSTGWDEKPSRRAEPWA
jgi:hypothetical protein